MMKNTKTVIWDWNGTLLNDTNICIEAMNKLLEERGLDILTLQSYRNIFTFPVKDYYEKAGFDFSKEEFEKPAIDFIKEYHELLPQVNLFPAVKQVLSDLKQEGYSLMILSAMEEKSLLKSVADLGIANYFNTIVGIDNHYANSKVERGKDAIKKLHIDIKNAVLVGDTLHDKEVAAELGCKCILVSNGHQANERLSINGNMVTPSLNEAKILINKLLPVLDN